MLLNRVKLSQKYPIASAFAISATRTLDNNGNILAVELDDQPKSATAYYIKDGTEVAFYKPKVFSNQEFEAPKYSAEETKQYKDVLYSEQGLKLLNRLKNSHLIKRNQVIDILNTAKVSEKLINKIVKCLYPSLPKRRRLDFSVEDESFNRIPLKDLALTKDHVMRFFIYHGLIYGKKEIPALT